MISRIQILTIVLGATASIAPAHATALPPNDLWKQDNRALATGISEPAFHAVLDQIELRYLPEFYFFNASLVVNRFWNDATVNAYAHRTGSQWIVDMYGGLARRPEITVDGFTLVACHEVGHHLGGYFFYTNPGNEWAAAEGEADTYATQACARYLWRSDPENARIAQAAPASVRAQCDAAWATLNDRDLCARIALASKSTADLFASLEGTSVSFDTHDSRIVARTNTAHPAAQCRLDTYVAGALCGVFHDFNIIPGIDDPIGRNSAHAELTAATSSCLPASAALGTPGYNGHDRPRCWFAPQIQ